LACRIAIRAGDAVARARATGHVDDVVASGDIVKHAGSGLGEGVEARVHVADAGDGLSAGGHQIVIEQCGDSGEGRACRRRFLRRRQAGRRSRPCTHRDLVRPREKYRERCAPVIRYARTGLPCGWAKTVLAPPPPAAGLPGVLSFQTVSGMCEMAEPPLALLVGFQYWPEPSLKVVPPMPVTSGTSAGESTASPAPLLELPELEVPE